MITELGSSEMASLEARNIQQCYAVEGDYLN